MADYSTFKVPDLKKLLQERGLTISGNKAELIARLQEADKKTGDAGGKCSAWVAPPCPLCAHTDISIFLQLAKTKLTGTRMTRL